MTSVIIITGSKRNHLCFIVCLLISRARRQAALRNNTCLSFYDYVLQTALARIATVLAVPACKALHGIPLRQHSN
jgi:hypothetical protein